MVLPLFFRSPAQANEGKRMAVKTTEIQTGLREKVQQRTPRMDRRDREETIEKRRIAPTKIRIIAPRLSTSSLPGDD